MIMLNLKNCHTKTAITKGLLELNKSVKSKNMPNGKNKNKISNDNFGKIFNNATI